MNNDFNQESYNLNPAKWINTLPKKNTKNHTKKYLLATIFFIIGIISVSIIKNETRNLQREIRDLQSSINSLKFDLHQSTLDYEVITSPENISRLAKEYLEQDFNSYKKSQIKILNDKETVLIESSKNVKREIKKKTSKISVAMKLQLEKQIEKKKIELVKLKEIYTKPEDLPEELRLQVSNKIEKTKVELKSFYNSPKDSIDLKKIQRWGAIQIVKAFLGIPIIPGK